MWRPVRNTGDRIHFYHIFARWLFFKNKICFITIRTSISIKIHFILNIDLIISAMSLNLECDKFLKGMLLL